MECKLGLRDPHKIHYFLILKTKLELKLFSLGKLEEIDNHWEFHPELNIAVGKLNKKELNALKQIAVKLKNNPITLDNETRYFEWKEAEALFFEKISVFASEMESRLEGTIEKYFPHYTCKVDYRDTSVGEAYISCLPCSSILPLYSEYLANEIILKPAFAKKMNIEQEHPIPEDFVEFSNKTKLSIGGLVTI